MIKKFVLSIIVLLMSSCYMLYKQNHSISLKYMIAMNNMKAYEAELDTVKNNNRVFQLTISQLDNSKDSIIQKLKETQEELKIKSSKIQQLQYSLSHLSMRDTIHMTDTIFKDPYFAKDTTMGDKWAEISLHLKYPNEISMGLEIELENCMYLVSKKETVMPPRKFFLWRLFQKRHNVVEVIVKEENPYVKNKEHRLIQIIK